ncbi:unnamed protein product [Schistosoma curassoni]|uniref:Integrase catalytic domain-containing protein n=1 Tax=Schistosoma curassoni TaxID=6186 RepID=A0A183KEF9_9TREM|nr:unnamed protein product [Schistosoma curassoni]
MKISNTLLSRHDELQSQGQSNLRPFNSDSYSRVNMKGVSTRNYKANHKGEMKFDKCLSCGNFHSRNSCAFCNAKCFKCALKFIYHPEKPLARSSAAMVQRWSIALSACDYMVQHRSAKQIQHVDYISQQSLQDRPNNTSECLLVQPLPVRRSYLIRETRRYFEYILIAIQKGWNANLKRRFPIYFSKRDELSTTPDGILCLNDRVVIPPSLSKSVLEDFHSGHLGVEKMKSLARLTSASTFNELERGVDTFLLQYRNARHSGTKETPAKLLKGRILRPNMRCLESAEVTYYRGNDLRPSTGIVLKNVGKSMVRILDINDLSTHSRHVDQEQFQEPGGSVPILVVNSNANEHILDNTESLSNTMSDRFRMNLRRRRTIDYKHLDSNVSCGGCGV